MGRGAWWAVVHGVAKSSRDLADLAREQQQREKGAEN